jgi:hypothetical protein
MKEVTAEPYRDIDFSQAKRGPVELVLQEMFNKAAAEVTEDDLVERESLLGGFAQEEAPPPHRR